MNLDFQEGILKGARASQRGPRISHLLFTNDCVILGEATVRGVHILQKILKDYESCSSQCVNFEKSTTFFSSNTEDSMRDQVARMLGVRHSNNPEKYLGCRMLLEGVKKFLFRY